jgi:hypothetical protein
MRTIFYIVVAIAVSACATPGLNSNFSPQSIRAGNGVLIASVTNGKANYFNGANQFPPKLIFVESLRGNELTLEGLVGKVFDRHIVNDRNWPVGRVIALEVVAGKYKFKSFSTPHVAYHIQASSREAIPLCFTVNPGEVVYIGNLDLVLNQGASRYSFDVADKSDRDFSHVGEKWPKLSGETIVKRLAGSSC